jgi:hypothetical protein
MPTVRGGRKLKNISLILIIINIFNNFLLSKLPSRYTTFFENSMQLCKNALILTWPDKAVPCVMFFFLRVHHV